MEEFPKIRIKKNVSRDFFGMVIGRDLVWIGIFGFFPPLSRADDASIFGRYDLHFENSELLHVDSH